MHEIDRLIHSYREAGLLRVIRNVLVYLWVTFRLVVLRRGSSMSLWQERDLLRDLLVMQQPKIVMEIGTAKGGTLQLLCKHSHPQAMVLSVDLPNGVGGGGYPVWMGWLYKWIFPRWGQELWLLRGDSTSPDTRNLVSRITGRVPGIGFLFIDGDHSYEGVKADYDNYLPMMAPRSTIVFHDISLSSVGRLWREIKNTHVGQTEEHIFRPELSDRGYGIGVLHLGRPFDQDTSWRDRYAGFNRTRAEADRRLAWAMVGIGAGMFTVFAAGCSVRRWLWP